MDNCRFISLFSLILLFHAAISSLVLAQTVPVVHRSSSSAAPMVAFEKRPGSSAFRLEGDGAAATLCVETVSPEAVRLAARAFAGDVERVTGIRPAVVESLLSPAPATLVLVGVVGNSPLLDRLVRAGKLDAHAIEGKWESALTVVVEHPFPGVNRALVIAGSDRRGAAYALFTLSRQMGVSPWTWWADVPVAHHDQIYVDATAHLQGEPSVKYRGIFINDEDWGIRPWAAKKMDASLNNIGPRTYERVFELLLRLRANTLWPAMHPGTLPFNAVKENAILADRWGVVMGSSHSEALLRNNVGEWDEKRDGPWNYQTNRAAIDKYWAERVAVNGRFENLYTVGMRGVHDTGLEATGTVEVKARLVESAMATQRALLAQHVRPDVTATPQAIWLYKESLELYRAGMKVPDDVTLGWTDDNYGYIRQLPNMEEQKRSGGSGVYYHVSYWGAPHDYLWLCTTPPALMREELTKAFDHQARRLWILNVGDIKPAELDTDYFMQLAWDETSMSGVSQRQFLEQWSSEQFPPEFSALITDLLDRYYRLNFERRAEFMGFNGYNDAVRRTSFNPLAWGDQNRLRLEAWQRLSEDTEAAANRLPAAYADAFFELVAYPIRAAASHNAKFLYADRTYLDAARKDTNALRIDSGKARLAYEAVQSLTATYNALAGGKWEGMMSAAPRNREVFNMPVMASVTEQADPLPAMWRACDLCTTASALRATATGRYVERDRTISISAAHFVRKHDAGGQQWTVVSGLGVSGSTLLFGQPGLSGQPGSPVVSEVDAPWVEYDFETATAGKAELALALLPTFPIDSRHKLRYAISVDGGPARLLDGSGSGEWQEAIPQTWANNVLRNYAENTLPINLYAPGRHTLRLIYMDPAVAFEHITIRFSGAPPAYPVAPETTRSPSSFKTDLR